MPGDQLHQRPGAHRRLGSNFAAGGRCAAGVAPQPGGLTIGVGAKGRVGDAVAGRVRRSAAAARRLGMGLDATGSGRWFW